MKKETILALLLLILIPVLMYFAPRKVAHQNDPSVAGEQAAPQVPGQKKVGDGVWELTGRDPVKQTLAKTKVNTDLVENTKALEQVKKNNDEGLTIKEKNHQSLIINHQSISEVYRWSVTLPSGTVFSFGLQDPSAGSGQGGILPVVKVQNKEGYYVRYYPQNQKSEIKDQNLVQNSNIQSQETKYQIPDTKYDLSYVKPQVKGNVITWEISEGITARYTMQQDRVKADYIVQSKQYLANSRLDFVVDYSEKAKLEEMPGGDLALLNENNQELFTIPAPVVKEKEINDEGLKNNERNHQSSIINHQSKTWNGDYLLEEDGKGRTHLSITLPKDKVATASWPLTIDPVVIDNTNVPTDATAYGNKRQFLRDPWGNLFAVFVGALSGADNTTQIAYKNYSSSTWTISEYTAGFNYTSTTADFDSSYNIHVTNQLSGGGLGEIDYAKATITRNASNQVTGISWSFQVYFSSTQKDTRLTSIVANKELGGTAEQYVVAMMMNTTSGGTTRGEVRVVTCLFKVGSCGTDTNVTNVTREKNASSTCSDTNTSGASGRPDAVNCKGASDAVFQYTNAHTLHNAVLTQIPGRPRRSPDYVQKDINGTFTPLPNTRDGSSGTSDNVNSLTTTDYIYIGDTTKFSKVSVDLVNTNTNAATFTTMQYCSAVSGDTCTSWSNLTNTVDNTATATVAFNDDPGSILFDEPANWVPASVNGVANEYWIRIRPSAAFDSSVSVADFYITDRNARALLLVGGNAGDQDLRAAYIPWDEVQNDRWENNPANPGNGWREDAGGASSALNGNGAEWDSWGNFPLSATVDTINNRVYVVGESTTGLPATTIVYSAANNKDLTITANWTDAAFPAIAEATDVVFSITSDGQDIYIFYSTDPGTNNLEWQRCRPQTAGLGSVCDHASDWNSAATFNVGASANDTHPQAIVSKAFGDTVAIDVIFTNTTTPTVEYERHFVDMGYSTKTVTVSGDDAYHRDCDSSFDDQVANETTVKLGRVIPDTTGCGGGINSDNHAGFRFQGIPVTKGAKIASAYLDFRVSVGDTGPVTFTVYGHDNDSSAAFGNLTSCTDPCTEVVETRTRTISSTAFETNGITFSANSYRIDVTDIIQEIVCRGVSEAQPCVGDFYDNSGNWQPQGNISLLLISSETVDVIEITAQDDTSTTTLDPTLQINLGQSGKDYSMGAATQLPTGSGSYSNLDHPMATSSGELGSVLTDDSNYASVSATTNASQSAQPAFMFKVNNSNNANTDQIDLSAIVRSSASPSAKPIYLQVYRAGAVNDWVTMATGNTGYADTDITLTSASITESKDEYYHTNSPGGTCAATGTDCWTFWRIYQEAPTTLQNETLSVDYFNVTYTPDPPISPRIKGNVRLKGNVRFE